MKTKCLIAVLVAFAHYSFATVHNLCNMGYSPGFTTFDDAQNAAVDGDIIYVHGSNFDYGSIVVFKALTIIGTGHNPDKQSTLVSAFQDIQISAQGVQLIGLTLNHVSSNFITNCTVKKCRIRGGNAGHMLYIFGASGWLIEGNIFDNSIDPEFCIYFGGADAANTVIQNNIFATPGLKIFGINNNSSQRSYILNNVFLGDPSSYALFDLHYVNFGNNIFYGIIPEGPTSAISNCIFNNNISFGSSDDTFYSPGSFNLESTNPQFVNYTGGLPYFDYSYDFSLDPASPGHNTGNDGTDRGVFGGIGFRFSTTGEPSIAEITAFTITSPTVIPPGGTLDISITSKRVH